jgi:hypothetical protein
MKLYFKISRFKFYIILFLILLIPVSKKYRLLLFGIRTEGIAIAYVDYPVSTALSDNYDYTLFRFHAEKEIFEIRGPENVIYKPGDRVRVIYNKSNPDQCMILSFAYLYSSPNAMIPGVLLLLWIAFYTSFAKPEMKHRIIRKSLT